MTTEEKMKWLNNNVGNDMFEGKEMCDFYYSVIHDKGMALYDADRYAWLNTLFGYDIGLDNALKIINRYHEYDVDVLELGADDMLPIMYEIGWELNLNIREFANETPKAYKYFF